MDGTDAGPSKLCSDELQPRPLVSCWQATAQIPLKPLLDPLVTGLPEDPVDSLVSEESEDIKTALRDFLSLRRNEEKLRSGHNVFFTRGSHPGLTNLR